MNAPDADIIISGSENLSASGARYGQVSDIFDLRLRDIAVKGLPGWWLTPPRTGIRRLITPWEYRHLRAWAAMRAVGGIVQAGLGAVTLVGGSFTTVAVWWTAFWLVLAALNLAAGYWYLTVARSASART
jgi:hypothetical protein